jgi:ribose transport system substrate-binding protein
MITRGDLMRIILKISFIITVLTLLLTVFSCNDEQSTDFEKTVYVIVKTKDAEFWKTVRAGAEAAGKEFGVNVIFDAPKDEGDIEGQIQLVNSAIERKANTIVLAACDYKKLVPVVNRAAASNIPVITIDSSLDSNKIISIIATNNIEAGKKACDKLIEISGKKCYIAIMNFVKGSASADQREEGLLTALKKYPGVSIAAKEYCLSDTKYSRDLTIKTLNQHPEVDTFVALNAISTEGVAQAVNNLKLTNKVKIVGFDSTPDEVYYMEKDIISAAVVQKPFNMGYLGVKYSVMHINGQNIPKSIDTGSVLIDKGNMYTPENQKLLFPFAK